MSLDRIAPKAIAGTHDGYVFTIANTVKDMEYISALLKDQPDAAAITEVFLRIYKNAANDGMQEELLSSRLRIKQPDFTKNDLNLDLSPSYLIKT